MEGPKLTFKLSDFTKFTFKLIKLDQIDPNLASQLTNRLGKPTSSTTYYNNKFKSFIITGIWHGFFLKRHGSQFGSIWQNWKFEDEFVKGYKVWGPVLNFSQTLISLSLPLLIGKKCCGIEWMGDQERQRWEDRWVLYKHSKQKERNES